VAAEEEEEEVMLWISIAAVIICALICELIYKLKRER
jgi:hypothetical protein